jgi:disulfide bond formation protein DsbB
MFDKKISMQNIAILINALNILGVAVLLILAFLFQFLLNELPCPLCLLQRAGFLITAIGFLFNLKFGLRPSHYVLSLLGALFTAFVALRQVALHVVPGSGAYGSAIFGLHMYTWSFIVSMAIVILTSITLGFDTQYRTFQKDTLHLNKVAHAFFALILVLAFTNFIAVVMECGFAPCPDNPVKYLV